MIDDTLRYSALSDDIKNGMININMYYKGGWSIMIRSTE